VKVILPAAEKKKKKRKKETGAGQTQFGGDLDLEKM